MDRQNIFLLDEKIQDLEGYPDDSKDGSRLSIHTPSAGFEPAKKASPIKLFVKWALIGSLIVLAMIFTSEIFGYQSSTVSSFIKQNMPVAH